MTGAGTLWLGYILALNTALMACDATPPPVPVSGAAHTGPGLTVVCSDFVSTSVALLNPDGRNVVAPVVIHSGQRPPGLQTALSGDVVLPSMPHPDGLVLLIDRHPNAVLTFVEPSSGQIERQISVATGFASNPHDAAVTADGHLLVTRYATHPSPRRADGLDRGDDVLVLDPSGEPLSRVGFEEPDGFPGRPDRIVEVSPGQYWVSLNRVSAQWEEYRPGRIARLTWSGPHRHLEPAPSVVLDDFANCGAMAVDTDRVTVSCTGAWDPSTGRYDRASSGLAVFTTQGERIATLPASDPRVEMPMSPAVVFGGDDRLYVVQYGQDAATPDRVLSWAPGDDAIVVAYEAAEAWSLWGIGRASDGVPLLPDAAPRSPRLCRLEDPIACISPCDVTGLPPKAVAPYLSSN